MINTSRWHVFENRCVEILQNQFQMKLNHIGKASDGGLDIIGLWPSVHAIDGTPMRIGVQCKSYSKRCVGVPIIRELEGSLASHRNEGTQDMVGILCSHSGFSRHSMEHFRRSMFPLLFFNFEDEQCARIIQSAYNHKLYSDFPDLTVTMQRSVAHRSSRLKPVIFYKNAVMYDTSKNINRSPVQ